MDGRDNIIDILAKTLDGLTQTINTLKDSFNENQQRYEDLAHEIRKEQDRELRRQRRDAYLIAFITVVAISFSVIVASYWSFKQEQVSMDKTQISQMYNQANELENKINIRLKKRDELMDAMVKVRSIRYEWQQQCKNGVFYGSNPISYRQKLFTDEYALVGATYKITGIFNNGIKEKIENFTTLANSTTPNICSPSAATDKTLIPLQTNINNLMLDEINNLRIQRELIIRRIEYSERKEKK